MNSQFQTKDDVLVLKSIGPKGGPGMPEAGLIPIPKKLARQGVKDMVRISDGRMSGTASGTIVLHVTPESYEKGPLAVVKNGDLIKGKIGKDLSTDEGYKAAERCAINIIAQAKKACDNNLNKIKSCVKLTGYVNSTDDFIEQPKVINGASDLIASVFQNAGMHTRAAVSTNSLPLGVSVEVDAIFELN